ncbi:asparaginase [Teredinibacter turnerae]|uniref:asparaginase n=1 Tax=Teredinibacter turnerae TaxID=2426 RepID=UPI0030CF8825
MTQKRIYVAYTGGTIGMLKTADGYSPAPGVLTHYLQQHPDFTRDEMPAFEINEYTHLIDSSNMQPANWQQIAEDIQRRYDDHDGFVILHGTDTMAYTASALSFMFENLSKPVIVTGSQIPLLTPRSDGQINLLTALYLAAQHPIPEVTLLFNNHLLRGNRATKAHSDGFDAFDSPNFPAIVEAGIEYRQLVSHRPAGEGVLKVSPITDQPIAIVRFFPGMDVGLLDYFITQPVKAIILQTYGVGNAPHKSQLVELLKKADEADIVVVNVSQCFKGRVNMGGYATGGTLAACGVISGNNMTLEAVVTKLQYLFSQQHSASQVRQLMQQDLRGELGPVKSVG